VLGLQLASSLLLLLLPVPRGICRRAYRRLLMRVRCL
jgi:hypothetical protein